MRARRYTTRLSAGARALADAHYQHERLTARVNHERAYSRQAAHHIRALLVTPTDTQARRAALEWLTETFNDDSTTENMKP